MKIASINNAKQLVQFCAKKRKPENENPISVLGERENLLKATVVAGFVAGSKALLYLIENGDFVFEHFFDFAKKLVDKTKRDASESKKLLLHLGTFGLLLAGFIAAIAALYTLYKTPNIMYQGKVNAFKKGKDMEVYIKSNKVERELYDQMNDKAKDATPEEKAVLAQQYLKLKAAKNQTPDYIKKDKIPS